MTTTRRPLAALASPSTAAVVFVCCGLALSANAATTRVHRVSAPSDKPAPVLQQSAQTRDKERGVEQSRHAAAPKAKDRAAVKPGAAHRKKAKPREPVPVDDPIPIHRAAKVPVRSPASGPVLPQQVSRINPSRPDEVGRRSARARREAHLRSTPAPGASLAEADPVPAGTAPQKQSEPNKLTVEDFVRAGGGVVETAQDSLPAPVPAAPTPGPLPAAVAQQKPAPIVRRAPSTVSAHPPAVIAQIKNAEGEPLSAPPVETVEGFGAEIETLPSSAPAKAVSGSKHMAVEKAAATDKEAAPALEARAKITDDAMLPLAAPLYTRSGKLIVPMPLKGTREILMHQNQMANDAGLTRIQDDDDLNRLRAQHLLSSFPEMAGLQVNEELPMNRRYARPWTVKFVSDIARGYFARFHEPLRLNSAVRTVEYQLRLQRVNGNAAAVEGETASPHLTGQAIDFGKHGMSVAEIAWMRSALLPLMQAGKIDVEEEFQQACFHISVYAAYAPTKRTAPKTEVAQLHGD